MISRIPLAVVVIMFMTAIASADTYSTFTTKRFFSAKKSYFVEVLPDKRATLYANESRENKIWSSKLPHLPARMFVSNDGTRVVAVDFYYGDGNSPSSNVLLFFDERGHQTASYALGQVANLARADQTTSGTHWLYGAFFTPDEKNFVLETLVRRCEPKTPADYDHCFRTDPYEELSFSLATGELVSRTDIQRKYADREKRLLHELELVQSDSDKASHVYALLNLARFYEDRGDFAKARGYYETAIPIYTKIFGPEYPSVASVVGEAAANCRKLKDYSCADQLFRESLTALDKDRKPARSVSPAVITVYEEYVILLRELNRVEEAQTMEKRAHELRAEYPNYKPAERH